MSFQSISPQDLYHAVNTLKAGGLLGLPTETVYGLAADASNEKAIQKIFLAKGRPSDHPLIVHLAHLTQLADWACANNTPAYAFRLAERFWPGPMTLILPKQSHVLDIITGGQPTVGLRIPNHPIAHAVLTAFGGGLAAPSANLFGHISPTSAQHVKQSLGDRVDWIIDGGPCTIGIESTIIDCTQAQPRLLRPGMITPNIIKETTGLTLNQENKATPRVSGALASHYAPRTPTHLVTTIEIDQAENAVVLSHRQPTIRKAGVRWLAMPNTAQAYAHALYQKLHEADELRHEQILIEGVPSDPEWQGIRDRLMKASADKLSK